MERQYDIRKIFQMLSSATQVIFIMRKDAAMACMLLLTVLSFICTN